jgi:hypothetical protein
MNEQQTSASTFTTTQFGHSSTAHLNRFDMNSSYQYENQALANSQAALPTYTQAESHFLNVPGRIYEDPNPQPDDLDFGGDWIAPHPEFHFDQQDENAPPEAPPTPGYEEFADFGAQDFHE